MRTFLLVGALAFCCAQAVIAAEHGVTDTADAKYDAATGVTTLDIVVAKDGRGYALTTRWRGKPFDAVAAHQKRSGWKDKFFFIRDDCLATGAARPWRCAVEHVFTLAEGGKDGTLAYIGSVHVGDECLEEAKFGCSLYEGVFTDVYDKLERNTLVSREESPAPLIELRVKDGRFVADLDETWGRNQERFKAGARCLAAAKAERAEKCTDGINPVGALMFNLTLATYARRGEVVAETRKLARGALCDAVAAGDCAEALRSLDYLLAGVEPGELPAARGAVKPVTAAAKK